MKRDTGIVLSLGRSRHGNAPVRRQTDGLPTECGKDIGESNTFVLGLGEAVTLRSQMVFVVGDWDVRSTCRDIAWATSGLDGLTFAFRTTFRYIVGITSLDLYAP